MADTISDTIEETAAGPSVASSAAGSATAQPLPDLIQVDQYLGAKTAVTGVNAQGGPRSLWNRLRPSVAIHKDPL